MKPGAKMHPGPLLLLICLCIVPPVSAQGGPPGPPLLRVPPGGKMNLRAGTYFRHYLFAFSFQTPYLSQIQIQPRGIFPLMEMRSLGAQKLYVATTTMRIRKVFNLARVSELIFGPCPGLKFPDKTEFQLEQKCAATQGLNQLERRILYRREGSLLHMIYVAYRKEAAPQAAKLLDSLGRNTRFYIRDR